MSVCPRHQSTVLFFRVCLFFHCSIAPTVHSLFFCIYIRPFVSDTSRAPAMFSRLFSRRSVAHIVHATFSRRPVCLSAAPIVHIVFFLLLSVCPCCVACLIPWYVISIIEFFVQLFAVHAFLSSSIPFSKLAAWALLVCTLGLRSLDLLVRCYRPRAGSSPQRYRPTLIKTKASSLAVVSLPVCLARAAPSSVAAGGSAPTARTIETL